MERVDADLIPFAKNNTSGYRFAFGTDTATDDINANYNVNIKKGWGTTPNEFPEVEDFNAMAYTSSYLTAYLYQMGISEWNNKQKYRQYSRVIGSDGKIYKAKTGTDISPNINNNPVADTTNTNWEDDATNRIGLIDYGYVAKSYHIVAFGGEFNRADYPKLWAYLQANPTLLKTQAQWTSEATANGGICGFYSSGDGTTTFRVPNLNKAFLRPDSRSVGSYQADDFKLHQHGSVDGASTDVAVRAYADGGDWGSHYISNMDFTYIYSAQTTKVGGSETIPKNIAVLPLIVAK